MNMQEFLNKLNADNALAEQMAKSGSPEAAYAIAKEAGLTESFENFTTAMKKLNDASGDLSADDIDKVTGGLNTSEIVSVVVSGVYTVSHAASAVAL